MEENSVDSIVTDPPYGLSFMNKKWDSLPPGVDVFEECLRVLKPGGHLLAFGGSRTYHRLACAVEDAGFEIRDQIMWVYGSGFPKSQNISKEIDKKAGVERKTNYIPNNKNTTHGKGWGGGEHNSYSEPSVTEAAQQWEGWGTALKPAHEPIVLARKPINEKTIVSNVLKYNTGAINIDECRIECDERPKREVHTLRNNIEYQGNSLAGRKDQSLQSSKAVGVTNQGRFPANFIHDGSEEVLENFPETGKPKPSREGNRGDSRCSPEKIGKWPADNGGSASRFFYCAKTSKKDRNEGLENLEEKKSGFSNGAQIHGEGYDKGQGIGLNRVISRKNNHSTVKPTKLMSYLCKLITPTNGIVLDPFMGSGSTGKAAIKENFKFIGIEKEEEYIKIAEKRIEYELNKEKEETVKEKLNDLFNEIFN